MDNNFNYNNNNTTSNGQGSSTFNPYGSPYDRQETSSAASTPVSVSQSTRQEAFTVPNYSQNTGSYTNPYSSPQYTPNDFNSPTPKKKGSGKKFGLSVAAICAALVISGGSFYAGVSYYDNNTKGSANGTTSSVVNTNKTVPATSTMTVSGDTTTADNTITSVVENAMPSMVAISTVSQEELNDMYGYFYRYFLDEDFDNTYEVSASGSGIIISQNNDELLIVTNNHVIDGADQIAVEFIDGESYDATVKGTAADNDLAVISVKLSDISSDTLSKIKVATLGDSTKLKLGESAIAIGNSLGYGQSVTVGYISATERTVQLSDKTMTLIQTDAAINPGNSGGALLNIKGEVIGINSAKYSDTSVEGTGYAIPISDAEPIIDKLMNSTYVSDDDKPFLGVSGDTVPETYQDKFSWPEGVYVSQVTRNSPAELAGLKSGDIITAINGTETKSMSEIQTILEGCSVGDQITLSVTRTSSRGKTESGELTATLISRKDAGL